MQILTTRKEKYCDYVGRKEKGGREGRKESSTCPKGNWSTYMTEYYAGNWNVTKCVLEMEKLVWYTELKKVAELLNTENL